MQERKHEGRENIGEFDPAVSGEQCTVCGTTEQIRIHHIDGVEANTEAENCVPMCEVCHQRIHADSRDSETWMQYDVAVPDDVAASVDREFVRLVCECNQVLGWRPDKHRHYLPLVVVDGVSGVEKLDAATFYERLDERGLLQ
ncbi:HNH endonuclease signature motif containing protein [Haloprofundus sp. MHR1]|uniref:HNH endonuclease signature motif containing protein n=1 Tax=Haloprofundus sp. MHR1 TaxID=2572921 RepID=UPI0010BF04A3|nr:HNH endonuclease signature motif containing protein [Haloprofundus sp. MHR1]QCJ45871.1 HNH endonuclease [Haloprofundus sp. MHR1]